MSRTIETVLAIGHVWPAPRASAAGLRMQGLLQCFVERGWNTHFACVARPGRVCLDPAELGVRPHAIRLNDPQFDHLLRDLRPDLVVFDRFMTEEQFGWRVADNCPDALRCLDTEDLHSLREGRRRAVRATGRPVATDTATSFRLMSETDLACRELAAIHRSDLNLLISSFEYELLHSRFGVARRHLHECPFMLPDPPTPPPGLAGRRDFVAIGNFLHAPNSDAACWLRKEIWPLIRQALGPVRLHLYGADLTPAMRQLHAPHHGFLVHGWVDDADAALRSARLCLAPLRFGAGLKGKLVQAMSNGTPSVTTPIGAEGIAAAGRWPGAVATTARALADAAIALYREDRLWRQRQALAPACLRRFEADRVGRTLTDRLLRARTSLAALRRDNFHGRMLSYHRHHTSRYLGKWIEAKQSGR